MIKGETGSISRPAPDEVRGALLVIGSGVRLENHIEVAVEAHGVLVLAVDSTVAEVVSLVHGGDGHGAPLSKVRRLVIITGGHNVELAHCLVMAGLLHALILVSFSFWAHALQCDTGKW